LSRILILVPVVATLALAGVGYAAGDESPGHGWATVNVCAPNAVGVRASIPGNGTDQRMQVRFTAQWISHERGAWLPVNGAASSPWLDAGSAQYVAQQAGWTFSIAAPPAGRTVQLRGVATLRWLEGRRVVHTTTRVTQRGVGTDVGTSRATCTLG
jgi:hypothetical protein